MCLRVYGEDPEPAEPDPAGSALVPVRSGSVGCTPRYSYADGDVDEEAAVAASAAISVGEPAAAPVPGPRLYMTLPRPGRTVPPRSRSRA